MSEQVQLRGGTTAEHATFTGAAREVTVDTNKNTLVVHDGETEGGHPLATEAAFDASQEMLQSAFFGLRGVVGPAATETSMSCTFTKARLISPGAAPIYITAGSASADITVSGPAVGGRDQSAAFGLNQEIHLHCICKADGSSCGLIWSSSPTTPTLPAGYTHSAYVVSVLTNSTSANTLYACNLDGDLVSYTSRWGVGDHSETGLTAVTVTGVPSTAKAYELGVWTISAASSGTPSSHEFLLALTSAGVTRMYAAIYPGVTAQTSYGSTWISGAVQTVYVKNTPSASAINYRGSLFVHGYRVFNNAS